jgi:hypothetical protein
MMQTEEGAAVIDKLLQSAEKILDVARTAGRNNKSLDGDNHYGRAFHDQVVSIGKLGTKLSLVVKTLRLGARESADFHEALSTLTSTPREVKARNDAYKRLHLCCEAIIRPGLEALNSSPVPKTEQVLPMAVVQDTRDYIVSVAQQANGCYEHAWFDACSVMVRRLVETLIIELYVHLNRAADIKGGDGSFLMLSGLVSKITSDQAIHLGRETKHGLPMVKSLGDRGAHNRFYTASKGDVDKVIHVLRVIVEELVHQADLKRTSGELVAN